MQYNTGEKPAIVIMLYTYILLWMYTKTEAKPHDRRLRTQLLCHIGFETGFGCLIISRSSIGQSESSVTFAGPIKEQPYNNNNAKIRQESLFDRVLWID